MDPTILITKVTHEKPRIFNEELCLRALQEEK